jgi:7-cyano-7-deazaguanine synthase
MKQKVVMGLSGGMDSTTLLGFFLEHGYSVECCIFYYGSKHNQWENKAAQDVLDFYKDVGSLVKGRLINISQIMKGFKSNLLLSGGDIPEGHYHAENMRQTVVPSRNLIFASIMAGIAESIGAEKIALGAHQGDHHIYPDCRAEFIKSLDETICLSSDRKVEVICPFLKDDKTSILQYGYAFKIPVPYHLTRTCYKDQAISCGKCGSCQERLSAFSFLGIADPIQYAEAK